VRKQGGDGRSEWSRFRRGQHDGPDGRPQTPTRLSASAQKARKAQAISQAYGNERCVRLSHGGGSPKVWLFFVSAEGGICSVCLSRSAPPSLRFASRAALAVLARANHLPLRARRSRDPSASLQRANGKSRHVPVALWAGWALCLLWTSAVSILPWSTALYGERLRPAMLPACKVSCLQFRDSRPVVFVEVATGKRLFSLWEKSDFPSLINACCCRSPPGPWPVHL
jgi:hypothetical protein